MFLQTASQQQQKIASIGEDAEKLESVETFDGNVKWHSYLGKQFGNSSKG